MVTQPHRKRMSVEEYLELDRSTPDARYEYIHGYVYMMAGGNSSHSLIKVNMVRELSNVLLDGPCFVYDSDMKVKIAEDVFVLPDASVSCDERDHQVVEALLYPRLVVEVLLPSTKGYDQAEKLDFYSSVPTIEEYVLVSTKRQFVMVYRRRQNNESWMLHLFRAGSMIELTSVKVSLPIEAVYKHVVFPEDAPG